MKIAMRNGKPFILKDDQHGSVVQNASTIIDVLHQNPSNRLLGETEAFTQDELEQPISDPKQIFAVGMNYVDHSAEIHIDLPKAPSIFTKFSSSLAPSVVDVKAQGPQTDWETEIVAVIKDGGRDIAVEDGWDTLPGSWLGKISPTGKSNSKTITRNFQWGNRLKTTGRLDLG